MFAILGHGWIFGIGLSKLSQTLPLPMKLINSWWAGRW